LLQPGRYYNRVSTCRQQIYKFSKLNFREDIEQLPPQDEIKYLVFRSQLFGLFITCRSCNEICQGKAVQEKGTFISIVQHCAHCGYQYQWNSQPFIKDTPAGNILLSAAILFSGSTPGKIFHFLECLRVACMKERRFYDHQSNYLQPAVLSVWKEHQRSLLSECTLRDSPVIIGGDGRADSPGHSAKYGSYGIIDLETNKVVHIELVQVCSHF